MSVSKSLDSCLVDLSMTIDCSLSDQECPQTEAIAINYDKELSQIEVKVYANHQKDAGTYEYSL